MASGRPSRPLPIGRFAVRPCLRCNPYMNRADKMAAYAFDLSAVANDIEKVQKYRPLWVAIRRFQSAASIYQELCSACGAIETLIAIDGDRSASHKVRIGRSLLMYAVIVYCRSTHSEGNQRWKINILESYNDNQRQLHRDIAKLRDNTFAHYSGGDGAFGRGWYREKVLLMASPENMRLGFIWEGESYNTAIVEALLNLLETAIPVSNNRCLECKDVLVELTKNVAREDEFLTRIIQKNPADLSTIKGAPSVDVLFNVDDQRFW